MTHSGKKWKIVFDSLAYSDFEDIDRYSAEKIKIIIKMRLSQAPHMYGLPLRAGLKGLRKLRIGDYRVVYLISNNAVLIEGIGHRKNIYDMIKKRLGL